MFPSPVAARYVRLVVLAYSVHTSMRAGVFVSPETLPKLKNFTLFNASITDAAEVFGELDVLLTGGRLGRHSRTVIETAYNNTLAARYDVSALTVAEQLQEQLMVASPEFQLTGSNPTPVDPVPIPDRTRAAPSAESRPYKAIGGLSFIPTYYSSSKFLFLIVGLAGTSISRFPRRTDQRPLSLTP